MFFRSMYRMGIFFFLEGGGWGAKIQNIVLSMPAIPELYFVNSRCWAQAYVARTH